MSQWTLDTTKLQVEFIGHRQEMTSPTFSPRIHQQLNGTESQRTPKEVAIKLLDTQV